jgi:pyruvate,water dikinase
LKLESLTLHDDPLLLLRSVGCLARRQDSLASAGANDGNQNVRRDAEARVAQSLKGYFVRRQVFPWVLRHTRARVRDRENLRFERTRLFGRVRRIFVELGRRLHTAGRLEDPRDVFLLEVDEVLGAVADQQDSTTLKSLVFQRHAEFAEYQSKEPPPNRFTTQGVLNRQTRWTGVSAAASDGGGEIRQGQGCCPGVVRGRIRKIVDPRNATLQPGEILVAARTDPGWILLFPAAAGLLVERGSLLSHSAIVAREMRIPAVVSLEGLTHWLNTGDLVEFDGATGRVRRLEQAPSSIDPPPKVGYPEPLRSAELAPVTS